MCHLWRARNKRVRRSRRSLKHLKSFKILHLSLRVRVWNWFWTCLDRVSGTGLGLISQSSGKRRLQETQKLSGDNRTNTSRCAWQNENLRLFVTKSEKCLNADILNKFLHFQVENLHIFTKVQFDSIIFLFPAPVLLKLSKTWSRKSSGWRQKPCGTPYRRSQLKPEFSVCNQDFFFF